MLLGATGIEIAPTVGHLTNRVNAVIVVPLGLEVALHRCLLGGKSCGHLDAVVTYLIFGRFGQVWAHLKIR